jgi:hypothetical protein
MSKILWKIALFVVPLAVATVSAMFAIFFISSLMEMSALETGGVKVEAHVIDFHKDRPSIKNISLIQITSIDYSFQVNGQAYVDNALGGEKVGDTLSVLYAKENPNISIPARVNVSEQKVFSGLAAALTLCVGVGLIILATKILWRKVARMTSKRN